MAQLLVHSWTSVVLGEIERVTCTCVYTMQYLLTLRVHFILKKKNEKISWMFLRRIDGCHEDEKKQWWTKGWRREQTCCFLEIRLSWNTYEEIGDYKHFFLEITVLGRKWLLMFLIHQRCWGMSLLLSLCSEGMLKVSAILVTVTARARTRHSTVLTLVDAVSLRRELLFSR